MSLVKAGGQICVCDRGKKKAGEGKQAGQQEGNTTPFLFKFPLGTGLEKLFFSVAINTVAQLLRSKITAGAVPGAGLFAVEDHCLYRVQLLGKVLWGIFRGTVQSLQGIEGGSISALVRHPDFAAVGPMAVWERDSSCVR